MRQVLAMYPLAKATRNGPFLAGYLKNLVCSAQGVKHFGSADGPATTSGPAARAMEPKVIDAATSAATLAT